MMQLHLDEISRNVADVNADLIFLKSAEVKFPSLAGTGISPA
jgi:hypothetical protein